MAMFLHAYQFVILPLFAEAISLDNVGSSTSAPPKKDPPKRSMSPEDQVRLAALSCLNYWFDPGNGGEGLGAGAAVPIAMHKECLVTSMLGESSSGRGVSIQGSSFQVPARKTSATVRFDTCSDPSSLFQDERRQKNNPTVQKNIVSVKILPVGPQNAASVQVQMIVAHSNSIIHGFLTFLRSSQLADWACISAAFADATGPILPSHFQSVTRLTWEGYRGANRARDGVAMAKVFHPDCRLTYVGDDDDVCIWSQAAFCDKVQNRYTNQTMHQPFASLQSHSQIGVHDTLIAVEFATPNLCMVTLKVGHPPCLWTDLLTCGYLGETGCWILHKSSCHEEFPLTDIMKAVLVQQKAPTVTVADDVATTTG
jgi:hypothetical protein